MDPKKVRDLSDEDLVKGIAELCGRDLQLTEWEKGFAEGLPDHWVKCGALTWKQRRAARRLLEKLVTRANRATTIKETL